MEQMEKLIQELQELVPCKETTDVGDIVLLVVEESKTAGYALVTGIERDRSRKDEWWEVHMQLLSIPPQPLVWTLRTPQFTGQELFTMGGKARFIKAVRFATNASPSSPPSEKKETGGLRLVK
jgi:hypothetical protein